MKINFQQIPDNDSSGYDPVPAGKYLVEVDAVEEKTTKHGEPMWQLSLKVAEGTYKGKTIRDNMTFGSNPKTLQRVKLVCSRLGIDVTKDGDIDISPGDLKGRRAIVETEIEDYDQPQYDKQTKKPILDEVTGQQVTKKAKRNKIPFAGYQSIGGTTPTQGAAMAGAPSGSGGGGENMSEEKLPF